MRNNPGCKEVTKDKMEEDKQDYRRIKKLDESVVNKIAAGEIIIQPANALKEMLENSIDAGSTMIDIIVKDGGLKLLQITDNGHGINKDDLALLCERFATSKLTSFDDLSRIATYGFRGEALASISHISRLSVITKTKESAVAYKAFYCNGNLATPTFKTSGTANISPKPVAGKDGTQILVEDLFYNIPSRLKSLRSKSDEFSKILDVIGRYAVHSLKVGISCKKLGESHHIISTRPNLPLKERVRIVFGTNIANELIDVELDGQLIEEEETVSLAEKYGLMSVSGAVTTPNYTNKKKVQPVFFINHRLVACEPLKRAISSIFQFFLPKGNYPFIYLSLEIDPQNLDVNVHPTKREVRFLHEEEIIEVITNKVHEVLSSVDTSRKFKTQSLLTEKRPASDQYSTIAQNPKKNRQENKLVRVDSQQSKISPFLSLTERPEDRLQAEADIFENESEDTQDSTIIEEDSNVVTVTSSTTNDRKRVAINLDSIKTIREEVSQSVHKPLTNIFNSAVYVGIVDEQKRLCCFQYDVKLYLCDYASVLNEFYFQIGLSEFCNYGRIQLSQEISLEELLQPLYENSTNLIPKKAIIETLTGMKDMLFEYFQIQLNDGSLVALPMILEEIQPIISKLPHFIYRLGSQVNFEDEKCCLEGIIRQIALLYVPEPISTEITEANTGKRVKLDHALEHILFPLLKQRFLATKNLVMDVTQITDLPGLYKVFERC